MEQLQTLIESAWESRKELTPDDVSRPVVDAVKAAIDGLGTGELRIAEPDGGEWRVHEWLKKAVLLYFRISENRVIEGPGTRYFDKVGLKYAGVGKEDFRRQGVRVVPPATVREGAFVARDVVLMPSYVNIGAYVDSGCMIDTWATVGSCAQIGKNVHISGGAGIGGVLEPVQATPTIIEDDCFVGARSEVVEGVVVEKGSVLAMGVFIGQSTRIFDREKDEIHYGRIPAGSVVVPGTLPSGDARYGLYCAVIAKRVDESTRKKTGINELLRSVDG